jgi:hypothetical protein
MKSVPAPVFDAGKTSKEETMKRVLVLISASVVVGLAAFAGSASAATNPSQGTGLVGACNMLVPAAAFGMFDKAMSLDSAQGNAGMFHAVAVSGC